MKDKMKITGRLPQLSATRVCGLHVKVVVVFIERHVE